MRTVGMTVGTLAAALLLSGSLALAADDTGAPATLRIDGGSTAAGVGGNWGHGILTFEGYEYPFSVGGLTIGEVGANGFTGSGIVHNLRRVEDFNGHYIGFGAGLTIAGGGSAIAVRNQSGVVINMLMTTRGLDVALVGGGIRLEIPESGFAAVRAQKAAEAAAARADAASNRIEAAAARVEDAVQRAERSAEEAEKRAPVRRAHARARAPRATGG